jgi:hypothetical protein
MVKIKMPLNDSLPFIAYGIFRPGDISYLLINEFVSCVEPALIRGTIKIRDGVKIYSTIGSDNVEAFLIEFIPTASKKAYECISNKEPECLYNWEVINFEGINCNVLVANKINYGSLNFQEAIEKGDDFWTIDQIYWENAFNFLKEQILNLIDEKKTEGVKVNFESLKNQQKNNSVLFRIQQNYLFLWSMVERFCYYRFDDKESTHRIEKLFMELSKTIPSLQNVQSEMENFQLKPANIYNSETLRMSHKIEEGKINFWFYYCLRNNMIHSMKTLNNDVPRAFHSFVELYFVFKNYFITTKNECLIYRIYE